MPHARRELWWRAGLAPLAVAVALMADRAFAPWVRMPFVLLYGAAVLAARFGGLVPGLLACALGTLSFTRLHADAIRAGSLAEIETVVTFALTATLTSWLVALQRGAMARAEAAAAEARTFEAEARRGEARLRAFLDHSPAVIYQKDLDGRFLMVNAALGPLLSVPRSDVLGRTDRDFFPEEVAEAFRANDRAVLAAGHPMQWEETVPTPSGPRTCLSLKFPMRDLDGAPYAVGGISTDITDRKRIEGELRLAKEAAEAATREKDQFLAMLSHELRTPLTPVLLAVSAVPEAGPSPGLDPSTLEMVRRNVEIEAQLIDDLLDLIRIHRGKMRLERRVIDAHDAIARALEVCRREVDQAGLDVVLDLSAGSSRVHADATRLEQVAWNLIKNAAKFTPRGGMLTIRTRNRPPRSPGGSAALVVEFADTGIGVTPADLARIFEAFDQGGLPVAQLHGGLGLGLAISRAVAEAHGGSLSATSPGDGLGTTFTLELPLTDRPFEESPPNDPGAEGARSLRILLVEDDADTLRVLSRLLSRRGHRTTAADSLAAALLAAESSRFDVAVCDLKLSDGSGLDLMPLLATRGVPVGVALSGHGTDLDIRRSLDAGFAEHLTKPVQFPRLEAALLRHAMPPSEAGERR